MRLVHLADLHIGYRQYQRLTPAGINQREADVAATFRRAIDKTIELRPDFVLIAGDVFHSVRPSNPAILHAFLQFARLVSSLPDAKIERYDRAARTWAAVEGHAIPFDIPAGDAVMLRW